MATKKYIGTKEVVRLTGLSTATIYDLIHNGELPAHKAPKSGWRIPYQALIDKGHTAVTINSTKFEIFFMLYRVMVQHGVYFAL